MPFDAPLTVELRPSRRLLAWILAVHAAAAVAVLQADLPPAWRLAALLALLGLAAAEGHGHRRQWAGTRLRIDGRGGWYREGPDGTHPLALLAPPVQFAGLLLLEVRTAPRARRRRWLLVRDMMDREHFRRLCVRARMDAEPRPVREGRPDDTSHAS